MPSFINDIDKYKMVTTIAWFIALATAVAGFKTIQHFVVYFLTKLYEIFIQHSAGKT